MLFEMVLEMAMACGAVCKYEDAYHFVYDMDVDFSEFGADTLGSLCVLLGRDAAACPCGFGELVYDVLKAEGEDFAPFGHGLGFSGSVGGEQYKFLVDYED